MTTVISDFVNRQSFLPCTEKVESRISNFYGSDNQEGLKINLKKQSADWIYRNKHIQYTFNSNGYRCPEWKDIDWANSCVLFGCSNVAGVGLDDLDTLNTKLSYLLDRPVINLGMPRSSIQYSFYNSLILNDNFPTPWAVVQLWTAFDRLSYFYTDDIDSIGHWNEEYRLLYQKWSESIENPLAHSCFLIQASRQLWRGKTRYVSGTTFSDHLFPQGYIDVEIDYIDYARDMMHPGTETIINLANKIKQHLI